MVFGQLPLGEQLAALRDLLSRNATLVEVVHRASDLDLPGHYVVGGALFQTVWNVLSGQEPTSGIKDYDLFYFDDADLSWDAEDRVIQRCRGVFPDVNVEVRNQARVHLWYEKRFGVPCTARTSTEDAIDAFASYTCCIGVRMSGGEWRVYAPHGLSDMFNFVVRPNPVLAPRALYEEKTARWRERWPLHVLPWPT